MKTQPLILVKNLLVLLVLLYLGGCASAPQNDEEGGISGTGHGINCDDLKQKMGKPCL